MSNSKTDHYAHFLIQTCLPPLPRRSDPSATPMLDETRLIVDNWVNAPGWGDRPLEERADMLARFANHLHTLKGERFPLEWLLFPINAARTLRERALDEPCPVCRERDERCAAALQNYALALKNARRASACLPSAHRPPSLDTVKAIG